ncbi:dak1 domain-containing protein [Ditylenchus destructor]|nr:dak1 domain-containing protein [Ditylenchus destructor]
MTMSAPLLPTKREKRRGVAGEIFMGKGFWAGEKAASGASLQEVQATAQKAIDNCRSIGVGLGPCTLPAVGHPNFQIEPGTMEVGIGHHGEPGVRVEPLKRADEVPKGDMSKIVLDKSKFLAEGTEVAVLVSGLGATPINELYILNDTIEQEIPARASRFIAPMSEITSRRLEMVGATLTVMALDDELKALLDVEARCTAVFEIDGKIGDGDHGVNRAQRGFGLAAERLRGKDVTLAEGLDTLGTVLLTEIGGSMGPLYGVMFNEFAEKLEGVEKY